MARLEGSKDESSRPRYSQCTPMVWQNEHEGRVLSLHRLSRTLRHSYK
jgi:hypothetical protein